MIVRSISQNASSHVNKCFPLAEKRGTLVWGLFKWQLARVVPDVRHKVEAFRTDKPREFAYV